MGLISWLFGSKKPIAPQNKEHQSKSQKTPYSFENKRSENQKDVAKFRSSVVGINKVKLVIDKNDPDTCSAVKRMGKIYTLDNAPQIPLDKEKCAHCVCYYEPVIPKD